MSQYKSPIRRTLLIGCGIFIAALCVMMLVASYLQFSKSLYSEYQARMGDAVTYVETQLDVDDLQECFETGTASATYNKEQQFLNGFIDPMELDYLYVVIPSEEVMTNVISATSDAERAAGETDMPIGDVSDAYTKEELQKYRSYWDSHGISFFEESSDWGDCYTAVKPLRNSKRETVALLCADVFIDELHREVHIYMLVNIVLVMLIGIIFGILLMIWLRRNIINPIRDLESSTRDFAMNSHLLRETAEMKEYAPPRIVTRNEVQSLSEAITKMTNDMLEYVHGILTAEERAETAEHEAESMTVIAYQDALTHVKSKAAYDQAIAELDRKIEDGEDMEFAIVMIDLNDLKKVNDSYGHEQGDKYIIGSCGIICGIYDHSPVFRIGGDEFVIILQGRDYENRVDLYRELNRQFTNARTDMQREPWERYSAAAGMAEYTGAPNETVEDVFRIADDNMYEDKEHMKIQYLR